MQILGYVFLKDLLTHPYKNFHQIHYIVLRYIHSDSHLASFLKLVRNQFTSESSLFLRTSFSIILVILATVIIFKYSENTEKVSQSQSFNTFTLQLLVSRTITNPLQKIQIEHNLNQRYPITITRAFSAHAWSPSLISRELKKSARRGIHVSPSPISTIIIHQTHYQKSDWSRAFNQFTIACELDMINAISAADIAFIMSRSTSAWLLSPLECSPQKQNG